MQELLYKIAWGILTKLLSDVFVSKFLCHSIEAWAAADGDENDWDSKVAKAMSEALGVADKSK